MQPKFKHTLLTMLVLLIVLLLSNLTYADTVKTGVVNADSVNIRSSSSAVTRENILTQFHTGKNIVIIGESGDYYKIQYGEGVAYIYKSFVGNIQTEQIFEAANTANGISGIVTGEGVNVREKPNTSNYTKIVVKLDKDSQVDIIDETVDGWYGINHEGKKLWISADFVSISISEEQNANDYGLYEDGQSAIVTATTLNLRTEPDPNQDNVIVELTKGAKVELLMAKDNWYKVNYKENEGWVFADYLYVEKSYIYAEGKIGSDYNSVNFREQPNTKANIVEKLNGGREVIVIGGYDKWCKVLVGEELGWIYAKYVEIEEASVMTSAYVIADRVNFRQEADYDSKIFDMLSEDTKVWILDQEDEWYKVNIDNKIGYVHSLYIQVDGVSVTAGYINADDVKMRSGPTTNSSIIDAYDREQKLLVYKRQEKWYKVKTSDGNVGWVYFDYVTMNNKSASRSLEVLFLDDTAFIADVGNVGERMAEYAKQFLGVPYVWGGTVPSGFDCSGLMKYVYKQFGINIMRVAADQARGGVPVSRSNLKPGDLIFFTTDASRPSYISHVGMYIGNGKFIHASSARNVHRVTISSLTSSYYYSSVYSHARRYGNY